MDLNDLKRAYKVYRKYFWLLLFIKETEITKSDIQS